MASEHGDIRRTYIYVEWSDSWRQKIECNYQGLGQEGSGELLFNGYRVSVLQDEESSVDRW